MKIKRDLIGISVFVALSIFFFVINYMDEYKLKDHGVLVIGKLISSTSEGEMGWNYTYKYSFEYKDYLRSFNGPIKKEIVADSIMFFRILPEDPSICRQLSDIRVPKCLTLKKVPFTGWKQIPNCGE